MIDIERIKTEISIESLIGKSFTVTGSGHTLTTVEHDIRTWLEEHDYESVEQLKGSMSQKNCPDPAAFERAQYMRAVSSYRP